MNIPTPPWSKGGKKIESQVRKALYTWEMIPNEPSIAIALSGGKDSLTLLFMLHAISGCGFPPFKILPIHVTGAFSCGAGVDLPYLTAICDQLNLPLTVLNSTQTEEKLACYPCARERRKLIFNAAKKLGTHTIAFGHHKDDHVQTLLMNLLHKGEFAGNLAKVYFEKYEITLIRPLIYVPENAIMEFAKNAGVARIVCRCPVGQTSKRKETKELIKHLEIYFPNARNNLAESGFTYGSNKAAKP